MQEIYVLLQYLAMTSLFTQINSNHSRNNIMGRRGAPDGHVV